MVHASRARILSPLHELQCAQPRKNQLSVICPCIPVLLELCIPLWAPALTPDSSLVSSGCLLRALSTAESETAPLLRQLGVIAARKRVLALQQWRMVFYLPNAVHWAFYKPPLHPGIVAMLGLAEAIVGMIQAFPQPKSSQQ